MIVVAICNNKKNKISKQIHFNSKNGMVSHLDDIEFDNSKK